MPNRRDDFDKPTVDALAKRAAFICSNPDCKLLTIAPSLEDETRVIYTGKAAHVTAASEGGPRYDPKLSSEERRSINNGIFLCSNCADMIDKNDGIDFPVQLLKKWKRDHETWVSENLNKRMHEEAEVKQTFVVTSHHQRGGITAGVVNISPQPRKLNSKLQTQLTRLLPDRSKTVTVTCVMGDSEAFDFATQVNEYLLSQGYKVNGVNQAVFSTPVYGQNFDSNTLTITIGTRQ